MIIWSSISFLIVIRLPTVCYFPREKPLVKPTAPGSDLYYICLCDLFSFAFIFRSIKLKIQKYLAALYFIWHSIYQYLQLSHVCLPISGTFARKGLTTPLTRRVASICYLSAGAVHVVLRDSPTGSITLVSSTEGNTYRCCAASSLPLWGNTDVVQANIKRNFWRRCRGDIINIYQVPNHKSHLLATYIIFHLHLIFLSPLHKKLSFYLPSFSFAVFSLDLSLVAILFATFVCVTMCLLFACIFACW